MPIDTDAVKAQRLRELAEEALNQAVMAEQVAIVTEADGQADANAKAAARRDHDKAQERWQRRRQLATLTDDLLTEKRREWLAGWLDTIDTQIARIEVDVDVRGQEGDDVSMERNSIKTLQAARKVVTAEQSKLPAPTPEVDEAETVAAQPAPAARSDKTAAPRG